MSAAAEGRGFRRKGWAGAVQRVRHFLALGQSVCDAPAQRICHSDSGSLQPLGLPSVAVKPVYEGGGEGGIIRAVGEVDQVDEVLNDPLSRPVLALRGGTAGR